MEIQHLVTAGRTRARQGQSCAGSDYDLLACLADAAAAAPLGVQGMQAAGATHRQVVDRGKAAQHAPSSEPQLLVRRHASGGPVSPSRHSDTDAGTSYLHSDREVRVTCNGTFGTFLIPSQTVQCHCARCAPESAGGESRGNGDGAGVQQQSQHHQGPPITPTEFERHSGLLTAKKWRNSIRLVQDDGTITIGKWLEQHNILPRPKCSGPLGSPGPVGPGAMAAIFGSVCMGADGIIQLGGPSLGNGHSHGAGGGGAGHRQGALHAQLGRCTMPPSRYPPSEYVTGEDDEYDEVGAQIGSAADGNDGVGLIAGEDADGRVDDEDYQGGLYGDAADAPGGHGGRGGRRASAHRGGRSTSGLRASDRRGPGRALGRPAGGRGALGGRGQRGRQAGLQRGAALVCEQQQQHHHHHQQQQHFQRRIAVTSHGAIVAQRGSGSGAGLGASSQEDGGEGEEEDGIVGGVCKGHSSSEGSPPSDDSKRRGGSGGSGEGDGSGTGDGGDSRRPGLIGFEGDHRIPEEAPGCLRRSARHGLGLAKAPQLQQQPPPLHQYQGGREGSADAAAAPERSTRHAAAIKRLAPDYLTGSEIGPLLKRARTRPSGAVSAGCGSGSGSWVLGGDGLAALYGMAAQEAAPHVQGWHFLGASANPSADQVVISVSINGRTYTGLLAPQQSEPSPPPPPPPIAPAAVAAGLPAPLLAVQAGSNAALGADSASGGLAASAGALSAKKSGGAGGSGVCGGSGRAPLTSTGRTSLPPLAPTSRLGMSSGVGAAPAGGQEDCEVPTAPAVGESADPVGAATAIGVVEDEAHDDGMPPSYPRCAFCHRCSSPVLLLPPPTLGYAPPPCFSPAGAKMLAVAAPIVIATAVASPSGFDAEGAPAAEVSVDLAADLAKGNTVPCAGQEGHPLQEHLDPKTELSGLGQADLGEAPESRGACDDQCRAASESPSEEAAGGGALAATGMAASGGAACASAREEASGAADLKPSSCTSTTPAGMLLLVPRIKVEVKSEGNPRSTDVASPAASGQQQQQQHQGSGGPVPEASRTARQAGCGLGPLMEVRCSAADAAGAPPAVVHSQCALWSPEVFVIGGTMYGVPAVIRRSRSQRCAHCGRAGASLSCSSGKCGRIYHLPCAIEAGAMLVAEPYSMACPLHRNSAPLHPASSACTQGRLAPSRLRPGASQDASQSTVTTPTGSGVPQGHPTAQPQGQQPPHQVPLPLSLQLASGRRVVLPPLVPGTAPAASAGSEPAAQAQRSSHLAADASCLPALMMLRTQADSSQGATSAAPQGQTSLMPPPQRSDVAAGATTNANLFNDSNVTDGNCNQSPRQEARESPAKRPRSSAEPQWCGGNAGCSSAEPPADGDAGSGGCSGGGGTGQAATAALAYGPAPWAQGQPPVFERRQASAVAVDRIAVLGKKSDSTAVQADMSSAQLEMSVASDGVAPVNSQGQGYMQAAGMQVLKRRLEVAGGEGETVGTSAASASAAASDPQQIPGGREGTSIAAPRQHTLTQPSQQQQQQQQLSLLSQAPMPVGGMPPMFLARGGATAIANMAAAANEASPGGAGITLGLGLGLGLDPASGLHLSHASAVKLLQQHPQLGGALPEGIAAMLLAAHQTHCSGIASSGGGCGLRQVGEVSGGSHGSTAAQTQTPRGMPGGGGRPRHHHHNHHHYHSSSQRDVGVTAGASASTASASTGTAYGRGVSGRGGGDESSPPPPPPQFQVPPSLSVHHQQQHAYSGGGGAAAMLAHMLPRAARNIEGLLPSRPLLHNPYVPSSGDPSADLMLSKIAQNGSREVEAELLGGTTGRVGHTGRCAVCVIQRKGKCGTESAPKKCLRRQLVALQRATGMTSGGSMVGLSGLSGAGAGSGSGASMMEVDEVDEAPYVNIDVNSGGPTAEPYADDRIAAAAAEQRALERARRETWSLPLGVGSGATGKRQPQSSPQEQFAVM